MLAGTQTANLVCLGTAVADPGTAEGLLLRLAWKLLALPDSARTCTVVSEYLPAASIARTSSQPARCKVQSS